MRVVLFALMLAGCPPTVKGPTCGEATCGATEICLQESASPECTDRTDSGAACPDGTTATRCGGAGMPCCCAPTPEPTLSCHDVGPCGAAPSCACVEPLCGDDSECVSVGDAGSRTFECLAPPMP